MRYPFGTTFHRFGEMGARRPFFVRSTDWPNVYDKERTLESEISGRVEEALPGVEVLAVELTGPERFTVFVDRPEGVDHALCEQVTRVLQDYLRDYSVDVSSPGPERPLRKPEHFRRVVGHTRQAEDGRAREGARRGHARGRGLGDRGDATATRWTSRTSRSSGAT